MKREGADFSWNDGSGVPPRGRLEHGAEGRTLSRVNRSEPDEEARPFPLTATTRWGTFAQTAHVGDEDGVGAENVEAQRNL